MARRLSRVFAVLLLTPLASALAHEIPPDVRVEAFVHPEGSTLSVLVRVPLEAMRDMTIPTREQGYLDLSRTDRVLRDAANLWISDYLQLFENEERLGEPRVAAIRVSLPTNRSFERFEAALAHLNSPPLPLDTELYWDQGVLDVLFEYSIESESSRFSVTPGLDRLGIRVINAFRYIAPDGTLHTFDFPGNPGRIPLEPAWYQVASRFVSLGFFHILDGLDHLLFLFCLIIPFRKLRSLAWIVTSFTIAHSITLAASVIGFAPSALWFAPFVEMLIAVSILYMAFENMIGAELRRRWVITFGFGLIHGFGFSFLLRETLQFAGSHLAVSLLAFNVGVELGQLLVLLLMIPLLGLVFRYVPERIGTLYLSALITHSAWHWMTERLEQLRQFTFPALDAALLASVLRMLTFLVLFAALVWLASVLRPTPRSEGSHRGDP